MNASDSSQSSPATVVMNDESVAEAIRRMAREIAAAHPSMDDVVLLGILRRGRPLADRLAAELERITGQRPKVGTLATSLYRDDVRAGVRAAKAGGATHFDFNVTGVTVLLVDDVIMAGRTARAAMDEVMDYGRPRRIQLACLVDRGARELPIQPDFCGAYCASEPQDHVSVLLTEIDGADSVLLEQGDPPEPAPEDEDGESHE